MIRSDVSIIQLDNPPVNALSQKLRNDIWQALDSANADPNLRAIVLAGSARAFSGGADIAEFGTDQASAHPSLNALLEKIESNPKPVVAAITGLALGGGLELALSAHGRVAHPDVKVGLPEVTLGIIPGAGGTQRLPRAIAIEQAIAMITSGGLRKASDLTDQPIFDELSVDVLASAVALASSLAESSEPFPRLRDRPIDPQELEVAISRFDLSRMRAAELGAIEAIRAGSQVDFDAALAQEYRIFERLHDSEESIALRHAFFAERQAGRVDIKSAQPITVMGIVGTGTMGRGIAISALRAGIAVIMIDSNPTALKAAEEMIGATLARDVEKGRLTQDLADRALKALSLFSDLEQLADADLIVEAIYEDMTAKQDLFRQLDKIAKADALLASNTSMLDINQIASGLTDRSRMIGLHFFSPAHLMKLVEVIEGRDSSAASVARGVAFCRAIGKIPVIAGVTHGFIGNRMLEAYLDRAFIMVEEGTSPYAIDKALEDWGMAMGPFRMLDLAGNDVSASVRRTRREIWPDQDIVALESLMTAAGRLGQKSGAGWYDYDKAAPKGRPAPKAQEILAEHMATVKRAKNSYQDHDIVQELVSALALEGQSILSEGHAKSASDIDVVYLHGYGFPRHRGGPMHYAARHGLLGEQSSAR